MLPMFVVEHRRKCGSLGNFFRESLSLPLLTTQYDALCHPISIPLSRFFQNIEASLVFYKYHPDENGPFGTATCLETFIKSCAGYSVITYILGVGDGHLVNLLLREDGRLFYVEFGFILGRDPKPFPPPMKLCKEMTEAMGGAESPYYTRFKSYCCEAYNILRKSSKPNLEFVSSDGGILTFPTLPLILERGILKLLEKLRLDLDGEASIHFFQDLINDSASALFPQMVETIHRWAIGHYIGVN